jgi:hypothetical protein
MARNRQQTGVSRAGELLGTTAMTVLYLAPAWCSVLGYQQGTRMKERQERAAYVEAQQLERCKNVVRKLDGSAVRFISLSKDTKIDCGIPDTLEELVTLNDRSVMIEPDSIQISLPTETELKSQIEDIQPKPGENDPIKYTAAFTAVGGLLAIFATMVDKS